jgi:seryl-tRNA synthetase
MKGDIKMSTNNIPQLLSYDEIWAMHQETARIIQETANQAREKQQEHDKEIAEIREILKQTDEQIKQTDEQIKQTYEQIKQTDEQIKQTYEQIKQTDKQIKQTNKQIGDLSNCFGEVEEYLVAPLIEDKFNELNYHFTKAQRRVRFQDENKQILAEVDIMLVNDDFVICIEVKVTPDEADLLEHIERLKIVHRHYKEHHPKEMKIIGAIAGPAFSDKLRNTVIASGLYVVVPAGNSFKIDVPENFQPRIFYGD